MLFGEWSFPSAIEQCIARMLSAFLLYMIVFLCVGVFISIRKLELSNILLLLWLTLSLSSVIYIRHTYPFASSEDFRYIFPSIISFIYFYLIGVNFFIECKLTIIGTFGYIIGTFGYIIAFLFIVEICFFFILLLGT